MAGGNTVLVNHNGIILEQDVSGNVIVRMPTLAPGETFPIRIFPQPDGMGWMKPCVDRLILELACETPGSARAAVLRGILQAIRNNFY